MIINNDEKMQATQVVLTKRLIDRLNSEAKRRTMSRSLLIRMACEKWLEQLAEKASQTA